MIVPKGNLLLLTKGEYSAHEVMSVARVLRDFDPDQEASNFRREYVNPCDVYLAWLIRRGFIETIDDKVSEYHLGFYDLNPTMKSIGEDRFPVLPLTKGNK